MIDKNRLNDLIKEGHSIRKIAEIADISLNRIKYLINKYELNHLLKYNLRPKYTFEKIDTKEKAYMLGFILCDASIVSNRVDIKLALADKCVVDFISTLTEFEVKVSNALNKQKRIFPNVRISGVVKDITKYTGGELKVERHYPRVRYDLEKYLLRGIFDADGCITWGYRAKANNNGIRIWQKVSFTSSRKILEGVQKMLYNRLSICTMLYPKKGENCYVLEISNLKDVMDILDYLYVDNDLIILKRKYEKYQALRLELEGIGGSIGTTM